MSSILLERKKKITEMPIDGVYVIYGASGTGKTTLAMTFPKPLLYIDILEGGSASADIKDSENSDLVEVYQFEELDNILTDVERGYALIGDKKYKTQYSTIVIDSVTQMEFIMKNYLMEINNKSSMNINIWGQAKDNHDIVYNAAKYLHKKTGANVVLIAHEKELKNDDNPSFSKIIPSIMTSSAQSLCAKASYVWYTKIENEYSSDKEGRVSEKPVFYTVMDTHPYLLTKTRKPKGMAIPQKVKDLTYSKFKKGILDKIEEVRKNARRKKEDNTKTDSGTDSQVDGSTSSDSPKEHNQ